VLCYLELAFIVRRLLQTRLLFSARVLYELFEHVQRALRAQAAELLCDHLQTRNDLAQPVVRHASPAQLAAAFEEVQTAPLCLT